MTTTVTMALEEFRKMENVIKNYDSLVRRMSVYVLNMAGEDVTEVQVVVHNTVDINSWYRDFMSLANRKHFPKDFEEVKR